MNHKQPGGYELLRVPGKGAMGLACEGRDPKVKRRAMEQR